MNVAVTGAMGMLGRQVAKVYRERGAEVYALAHRDLDITDREAVFSVFEKIRPELLVNCAAYTNVDGAEEEPEKAFNINGLGPRYLALACRKYDAVIMHVSTDYIFNGVAGLPYSVYDLPGAINTYGASKLFGEAAIREVGGRFFIVRTSWLFGPYGKNFVDTILHLAQEKSELRVVDDQCGSPTLTNDLAGLMVDLAATGVFGTYHATNGGVTTWYGLAKKVVELAGLPTKIYPCGTDEFPRPAARPRCSALNPFPLKQVVGYLLPPWENAVERYITFERNGE